jgi:hypothetical protein
MNLPDYQKKESFIIGLSLLDVRAMEKEGEGGEQTVFLNLNTSIALNSSI